MTLTPKMIWHNALWGAAMRPSTRQVAFCIGRFFDQEGNGSSMSHAQIAADTGYSPSTIKRAIRELKDRWLHVQVQEGRQTRNGCENLYNAMIPPSVSDAIVAEEGHSDPRQAGGRGVTGEPLTSTVNQNKNRSSKSYGSSGREALQGDTANVVPFARPWGRDLLKGGAL